MELTVAANYDQEAIPRLAEYPVTEVFGKLPADLVGGGRASYMSAPVGHRKLRRYVRRLDERGIAFNYLLNSSCLGGREWSRRWQRRFGRFLRRLWAMGIRRVTVSTPFLLERVKMFQPRFHVKVGIFAQVDTPRRARFWRELGADAITLESFSVNRDFPRLAAIRQAVDCPLQLIVNHPCLPNCPLQPYHQNLFAHASDGSGGMTIDYCFLACAEHRLRDPASLIQSPWIRPEDLARYRAIGLDHFKILERGMPSEDMLRRVRAYSTGRFDGNLAELILPYGFRRPVAKQRFWLLRHFFRPWQVNPLRLGRLRELIRRQGMLYPLERLPIRIDSREIPEEFLDGFDGRDCCSLACGTCGYCGAIAARAVSVDRDFQRDALSRLAEARDSLASGRIWGMKR